MNFLLLSLLFFSPTFFFKTPFGLETNWSFNQPDLIFTSTILLITTSVIFWSNYYMEEESQLNVFTLGILSFVYSMILFTFSNDVLLTLMGYDLLGVTSFYLIYFFKSWSTKTSAIFTLMTNKLGDVALFMSTLSLLPNTPLWSSPSSLALLFLSVLVKSAQIPFNSWLPIAMAAPTPVSSLVHSSTLVTAGAYLVMKYVPESDSLLTISLLTLLLSSLSATMEKDMKKVVALSTMSQMSFILTTFSLGLVSLSFFHLITHAFFKSLLFLSVGNLIHTSSSQLFSHIQNSSILNSSVLQLCVINLMGLAFTSGAASKESILNNSETLSPSGQFYFVSFTFLTFLYSLRLSSFFTKIIYKPEPSPWSVLVLSLFSIFLGELLTWELSSETFFLASHLESLLYLLFSFSIYLAVFSTNLWKLLSNMSLLLSFSPKLFPMKINEVLLSTLWLKMSTFNSFSISMIMTTNSWPFIFILLLILLL